MGEYRPFIRNAKKRVGVYAGSRAMVYEQPFDEENRVVSDCQTADISHHFTFTCVSPERNPPFSYYFFPPPPLFFLFAFFPLKYSPPSLVFFFLHFFFSCLDFHFGHFLLLLRNSGADRIGEQSKTPRHVFFSHLFLQRNATDTSRNSEINLKS